MSLSTTGAGLINLGYADINAGTKRLFRSVRPSASAGAASTTTAVLKPRLKCDASGSGNETGAQPLPVANNNDVGEDDDPVDPGSDDDNGSSGFGPIGAASVSSALWLPSPALWTNYHKQKMAAAHDLPVNKDAQSGSFAGPGANLGAGNLTQTQSDLQTWFPAPLTFSRTYNSQAFAAQYVRQNVGVGWRSNWDSSVALLDSATAVVSRGTDASLAFTYDVNSQAWLPPSGFNGRLTQPVDATGTAVGWTLSYGDGHTEQFDALGRLALVTRLEGTSYALAYDSAGRLQAVQNNFGRQMTFAYNGNGQLATMTDPGGGVTSYGYGTKGELYSVTYADGRTRAYRYLWPSWPFALSDIIDGLNDYAMFSYDGSGRLATSQFAGGVGAATYAYNANSTSYTDPAGTVWTKQFNSLQGEIEPSSESVSCSVGCSGLQAAQSVYTGYGALSSYTDRAGVKTVWAYNSRNLPTTITEAAGRPETRDTVITWHPSLEKPTNIQRINRSTRFTYDANGRLTQRSVLYTPLSRTVTYAYTAQGLVTSVDDARTDVSDVTTNTYDSLGNLAASTDPKNRTTTYSQYTGLGKPGQIAYADGTVRTFTYHARGRVLTQSYAGNTTTTTYDANGNVATVSNSDGSSLTYLYDAAERLTGINDQLGQKVRYTLDSAGRQTRVDTYDSANNLVSTVSTQYDGLGHVSRTIDANGKITDYKYDAAGNLRWVQDPLLNVLQTAFDGLHRATSVTGPNSYSVSTAYDVFDNITGVTDPKNNATTYAYTGLGDQSSIASPDTGTTTFTYDSTGNVSTKQDARGYVATTQYDSLNRPTTVSYSDGQAIAFTYDTATNGIGKIARIDDPSGYTTYTYDVNGRIASKSQFVGSLTSTLQYGRDGLGRITSVTYPSGKVLGITYTEDRVTALTWNGATVVSGVQYFPFGAPESWLFGGTTEYTRYIDDNNRVTKYLVPGGYRTLTYDDAGRLTQVSDSNWGGSQSFGYDANGRLTSFGGYTAWPTTESRGYTYDANGNRLTGNVGRVGSTYTYAATSNRLLSVSGGLTLTNRYDSAGNLTSDGQRTFTYDGRGRLVAAVKGSTTVQFNYNGLGQRVFKWLPSTSAGTVWVYDESGHVVGEYVYPSGAPIQELVWLGSIPVAVAADVPVSCGSPPCTVYGVAYIWTDQLDTPRAITNSSGTRVWQWDSAPFGETSPNPNPMALGQFVFNHRFPGQYLDVQSGLHQNGDRIYDPILGRYIQSDPFGLRAGSNTYQYVGSNPLSAADPSGLVTFQLGGTVNLQLGSFSVVVGGGIAWDNHGNLASYTETGWGVGPGIGGAASGTVSARISNGNTIFDLSGPFTNVSGGGGYGLYGSGEGFYGYGADGQSVIGAGIAIGVGEGANASYGRTDTTLGNAITAPSAVNSCGN